MVAGALNGGAIMHKAVVPGDRLGGLDIYLWDLSDGGSQWRGGEAEEENLRAAHSFTAKSPATFLDCQRICVHETL